MIVSLLELRFASDHLPRRTSLNEPYHAESTKDHRLSAASQNIQCGLLVGSGELQFFYRLHGLTESRHTGLRMHG